MSDIESYLQKQTSPRGRSAYQAGQALDHWRSQLRTRIKERLGGFPTVAAELNPVLLERTACDGYIRERVEITTYAGLRMPIYMLIPDVVSATKGSRPAIIACHGHGYGSREICGMEPDGSPRRGEPGLHKDFAVALVQRGYVVAAPELLGFGDRRLEEDRDAPPGASSCTKIAAHLLMTGQTLAGHRIYETMRVLDYITTRPGVASARIGSMGISGGGLVTAFTAALDKRCRAAVVSGYANTFQGSILDRNHCLDNYIPGIMREAELPDIIGLIAPRPLFIEAGSEDQVFPLPTAKEAYARLTKIYEQAGAQKWLDADFFTGGHEISGAKAYDWLDYVL
ncbi:MAG TPA: dienelactone hydrolase [Paenibacillus sp.]|uniref:alpha/beta hydrolase family protein n=1 Tax=Paenibacillus TaxID=44249 RepID=UPI000BA13807|nr:MULTISPECIES: alpha/beta hydrolase family protein [Paenibacillus]OZQ72931.1 dienelactone hydrolase [Paenibacillus taichungensis]HBU81829.1 dienelactone hydrolase [Paenibacillus sp.]